jgi:transcription termination/antitermination protein NusG
MVSDELTPDNTDQSGLSDEAAKAAAFLDPDGESGSTSDSDSSEPDVSTLLDAIGGDEDGSDVAEEATPDAAALFGAIGGDEEVTEAPAEVEAPAKKASAKTVVDDDFEDAEPGIVIQDAPDDGIKRRWYAVHVHSGQEAAVQRTLIAQAELEGLTELIINVLVPMEEVVEFKSGEKKVSKRKCFPGYLLAQLPEHPERYADLWHLIKETHGVTGFIGSRNEPVPLEDSEVMELVQDISGERERPRARVNFDIGERLKIIDGAFANFFGNVSEINEERGKMKVMIEIFERETSVEVEFWQVEKL